MTVTNTLTRMIRSERRRQAGGRDMSHAFRRWAAMVLCEFVIAG